MYAIEIPQSKHKTFEIAEIPDYVWYGVDKFSPKYALQKDNRSILRTYFKTWKRRHNRNKTLLLMANIDIDTLSPPRSSMGSPRSPQSPNSDESFIISPTQEVFNRFRLSTHDIETKFIAVLNYVQQFIITYINDPYNKGNPLTTETMEDILHHCKLYNCNFKVLYTMYSDKFWLNYIQMIYTNCLDNE